jgi:hypothetical protein
LDDLVCQVFAQSLTAFLHLLLRDPEGSNDSLQSWSDLLALHSLPLFSADLELLRGLSQVQNREPEAGLESMSRGIEAYQAIGNRSTLSMRFTLQAEALFRCGQVEQSSHLLR